MESDNNSEGNEEKVSEKQIEEQNKQIKMFVIVIGGILLFFLAAYLVINSMNNFNYNGVDFKIVKEGNLIFYNTAFPYVDSITGNYIGDWNFYIRNDPRKLDEEIHFDGDLMLMKNIVVNSEDDFNCEGDGVIAIANLAQMLDKMGADVMKDENATCDEQGRYTYLVLKEGNETNVEKFGPSCYNININNCEILKGTERFMIKSFVQFNEQKTSAISVSAVK